MDWSGSVNDTSGSSESSPSSGYKSTGGLSELALSESESLDEVSLLVSKAVENDLLAGWSVVLEVPGQWAG